MSGPCRLLSLAACVASFALAGAPAWADMYMWRDPQTGAKRMSNIPPRWVVEQTRGPRVQVIRGNTVIDLNTSLSNPLPAAEPSARQRAMGEAAAAASSRPKEQPPAAPETPPASPPEDD